MLITTLRRCGAFAVEWYEGPEGRGLLLPPDGTLQPLLTQNVQSGARHLAFAALEQLYNDMSRNRDEWALAEIEQVLSTASQQLQLAGNVPGALIALQNAELLGWGGVAKSIPHPFPTAPLTLGPVGIAPLRVVKELNGKPTNVRFPEEVAPARKMIAELVEHGYAEREQTRDDGKFGASVLVIFDEPRGTDIASQHPSGTGQAPESHAELPSVAFLPQTDLPATAKPSPDSPSPVKSAHSNNLQIINTDDEQEREQRGRERSGKENNPRQHIDANLTKRVQAFVAGHGFKAGEWTGWGSSTIGWIVGKFAVLSDADREAACRMRDVFLEKCKREGIKPMPVANYFRDRVWEMLSDEDQRGEPPSPRLSGGRVAVPVFGPVWAASAFLPRRTARTASRTRLRARRCRCAPAPPARRRAAWRCRSPAAWVRRSSSPGCCSVSGRGG